MYFCVGWGMSESESKQDANVEFPWETIRTALESDGEGIYDWDVEKGEIKYSSHCLVLMGIKEQEKAPNIFTEWDEVVFPEDRAYFSSLLRRYLEGYSDVPFRIEVRLQSPKRKSWRWVRVTGIATRNALLKATRLVGAFVDVTRRKTAEAQLEEERHLFRLLINHIPDNIFFKNRESRFVMANISTAQKLKVPTPSDLVGRTDAHFFDEALVKDWRKQEEQVMETGQPLVSELKKEVWQNGSDTWCMSTKIPWRGKNGELKGILGISSDVTSLKVAEQQLRRVAEELEFKNQALEKEMRLAREVQLALLPQQVPPVHVESGGQCRSLTFAHKYQASGGVAGDWFEVFPINESSVGIFICDVMGHGVRSALVASMIRGLLEEAVRKNPNPGPFLELVNNKLSAILARSEATMFATALYLLVDLEKKEISYACAGHPAPFVLKASGEVLELPISRALALGLVPGRVYPESTLPLEQGLGLLLFTDGIIEASNSLGEEVGRERLQEELRARQEKASASCTVESVLHGAQHFTGEEDFEDDVCLLSFVYEEREGTCPLPLK